MGTAAIALGRLLMTTMAMVLVIEDDPTIRQLLSDALIDEGYAVTNAVDGLEALDALTRSHPNAPDAIILDLMMPVMDGWRFRAEQIERRLAPDTPIIILTASRHAVKSTDTLMAYTVLPKPFDLGELLAVVAAAVGATVHDLHVFPSAVV